jgi:hypothetical protein
MKIKLDWFVDNELKQTFNSHEHAAEVLRKELNNLNINYRAVKKCVDKKNSEYFRTINVYKDDELIKIFKTNLEFMYYYNISDTSKTCNVINGKVKLKELHGYTIQVVNNIPDIRLHIYEETKEKRKCTYCEIEKPFTNKFFYIYPSGRYEVKCKDCNNKRIGDKHTKTFIKNLDENWKNHQEFTNIYFERDTLQIFNTDSGKYLTEESLINICHRSAKDLKWEAFFGKIPEDKIVKFINGKSIQLDNLICEYIYCNTCQNLIKNPTLCSIYCSNVCMLVNINNKQKQLRNTDINKYLSQKWSIQKIINKKYNTIIDYDSNYLKSLGNVCYYCGISCKFGNEKEVCHPDTLTFDKKNSDIGYIKENIVSCCLFCNRMKNKTTFEDWKQFINFIKDESLLELDLSNKKFAKNSSEINLTNVYFHIKQKSPGYYQSLNDAKNTFIQICKKQNYLDPFFNFFPIINLGINCLFNASIDAIDSTLISSEKHKPDNIQVILKCFNYGKNTLSNEEFIKEWKKRGFKTNFEKCNIKLPENYFQESYFNSFILN